MKVTDFTYIQMANIKKFGTFGGVFTPSLLTIFGVIMFLMTGYFSGFYLLTGSSRMLVMLSQSAEVNLFVMIAALAIMIEIDFILRRKRMSLGQLILGILYRLKMLNKV